MDDVQSDERAGEAREGEERSGAAEPGDVRKDAGPSGDAVSESAQPEEEKPGDAQTSAAQEDEERVRAVVEDLRRLKVEDLALDMAVSLVTVGYQKLGLTEQTRELRDLGGARLSIELLRALLDVLEREGAAAKLGDLRSTLAAMQLNYAYMVGEAAKPAPEDAAPSA